jgi:hypothetical protein
MAINDTTESTGTTRTKARARKAKEKKVDLKKLSPAAHAAAAAAVLEKEQAATTRKREGKRGPGPAHPAIEGRAYFVVCEKCDFTKQRKHYSDAAGWQRSHSAENKGHAVAIEQRDAKEVAKKANRKDKQKHA